MVKNFKAMIEKHDDGYVAYPVGLQGVVVTQGDTYEEALENLRSAVAFHIDTFGSAFQPVVASSARLNGGSNPHADGRLPEKA